MEHIDADSDIREATFGKGNETSMHVTCEKTHPASYIDGVTIEVFCKTCEVDRGEYVNDAACITIRYVAMVFIDVPTPFRGFLFTRRAFKFVYA